MIPAPPKLRYKFLIGEPLAVRLVLVGCGGTGSFAALNLARWAWANQDRFTLSMHFVDPDIVEPGNIGRQNFVPAELGHNKARALAFRYSAAFGFRISASAEAFSAAMLDTDSRHSLTVLIGCVDNTPARIAMHQAFTARLETASQPSLHRNQNQRFVWIDAGNGFHSGQVLVGNALCPAPVVSMGQAVLVPLPTVQEPGLLEEDTTPDPALDPALSCAELTLLGAQARTVNAMMAQWIDVILERLFLNELDYSGVTINQRQGLTQPRPITDPVQVKQFSPLMYLAPTQADIERIAGEMERVESYYTEAEPEEIDDFEHGITCPVCGGPLLTGLDNNEHGQEITIIFCENACLWQLPYDEYEETLTEFGEEAVIRRILEMHDTEQRPELLPE